jgi:predicted RNase H-like HicB family nuclease
MRQTFTASITREGDWYIAHCLEIDLVSQGETEDEAFANLGEAIQLYFEPPVPATAPTIRRLEVEIGAA